MKAAVGTPFDANGWCASRTNKPAQKAWLRVYFAPDIAVLKTGESLESMHAWSWSDENGLTHLTKGPYPFHSSYRTVVCAGWMVDLMHAPYGATVTCFNCILEVWEW